MIRRHSSGSLLLGELHRALHVGEQHRHLLALALEGAAGADLLGEVLGDVRAGGRARDRCAVCRRTRARRAQLVAARVAELLLRGIRGAAARTRRRLDQGRRAVPAEARALGVGMATARTVHFPTSAATLPRGRARGRNLALGTLEGPPCRSPSSPRRSATGSSARSPSRPRRRRSAWPRDRRRRARPAQRADRLGQDARRVPLGHRPARERPAARGRAAHADRLRLAAEGAGLRRRPQPRHADPRHRRGRQRRRAHRRHAAARARADAPPAAGHPDHDARVALPDADERRARDADRRRGGDRRRDPRRRRHQARLAPGADAGAAGRDSRTAATRSGSGSRRRRTRSRRSGASSSARGARRACSTPACASRSTSRSTCRSSRWSSPSRAPASSGDFDHVQGSEATRRSIWPAIYPELLKLVEEHTSTIIFVNNRRGAERLALRLNEAANAPVDDDAPVREIARAHHGSLSREERTLVEEQLKAGDAAVPGRDEQPRARHRHGRRRPRAPGRVAEVRRARAAAHRPRRPRRRRHEQGPDLPEVPRRPARVRGRRAADARGADRADRRAAQRARRARAADRRDRGLGRRGRAGLASTSCSRSSRARTPTPSCRARCSRTCSTCSTAATRRRSSPSCAPRIVWDRVGGTIRPRKGAGRLAITNAGTIPDRGLFTVVLPDGRRVGELDEEMVYEARPGQTFLLGASTWRIEEIGRDRVIVTPAPGAPGAIPFWHGDSIGRPKELGIEIGALARTALEMEPGAARGRLRPRRARRAQPARLPARAAGRDARHPVRPHRRRRALPRRDRRLAAVRALALRRPRARRLGPRAERAAARRARARVRRDLVGRGDHRPPARRRRAAGRGPRAARPGRRSRTRSSPSSARARCSARASARTPRARC